MLPNVPVDITALVDGAQGFWFRNSVVPSLWLECGLHLEQLFPSGLTLEDMDLGSVYDLGQGRACD